MSQSLTFWADISVIWLSLLCFIGLMIPLAITFFAIRGMNLVLGKTPGLFQKAQSYSSLVRSHTESASERIAGPVVRAGSETAKFETTVHSLLSTSGERPASQEAVDES